MLQFAMLRLDLTCSPEFSMSDLLTRRDAPTRASLAALTDGQQPETT
jgi:hypothetical protein